MNKTKEVRNYFDSLAPHWSDRYLDDSMVQSRLNLFKTELNNNGKLEGEVLDFGCGSGEITYFLSDNGYEMQGTDVSVEMIKEAKETRENSLITWQIYSGVGRLNYVDNQFDAVISSSVLEYAPNIEELLSEFFRILKPGGVVIFTVPDLRHWHRLKESVLILLLKIKFIKSILVKSKWSEGAHYLLYSKNRLTIKKWLKKIKKIGFIPSSVPECKSALVLISAIKSS